MDAAVRRAPGALAARRSSEVARLLARLAAAPLLPVVVTEASALRNTVNLSVFGIPIPGVSGATPAFSIYSVSARAQQALLDAAALVRVRAARDSAASARADAAAATQGIAFGAAVAYERTVAARAFVAARTSDSATAVDLLGTARALVRTGSAPPLDTTRAALDVTAARSALLAARVSERDAVLDLASLLDLPPDVLVVVPTVPTVADSATLAPPPADPTEADAAAQAAVRRPELAAARARQAAAAGARRAVALEYVPRVSAFVQVARNGVDLHALSTVYQVGVQVSLPLLDGFTRPTRAALAAEQQELAALDGRAVAARVAREARGAALELAAAREDLVLALQRERLAERELFEARARYRAGLGGATDATRAVEGTTGARSGRVGAALRVAIAVLDLRRATGVLPTGGPSTAATRPTP